MRCPSLLRPLVLLALAAVTVSLSAPARAQNTATVTIANVMQSNGVIHVINGVLQP